MKHKYNLEKKRRNGFTYYVSQEQLDAYRKWPIERRLEWLLMGNQLRKSLPGKTIAIQEAFRQAKIKKNFLTFNHILYIFLLNI